MTNKTELTERFGTCSKDCYGACVFKGKWNDQALEKKFLQAKPRKEHPFTNGFFCAKLNQREKLLYHPQRLKTALVRTGPKGKNSFKPANLEETIILIAEKLEQIKKEFGASAIVAAYYAANNGMVSKYSPFRFFGNLGATITSEGICNEAGCASLEKLFGTYSTTNPLQIINPNNRLIVIWGSNLSDRNNHAYYQIKKAIKTGSRVIVVNPIKTPLVKDADLLIQPFPGTDFLIAKFILHEIISSEKHDRDFVSQNVDNFKNLLKEIKDIDENKIISQIGVDRKILQDFIDLLLKYKHETLFIVGFGPQKYFYGGKNIASIALIQIILGNFGKPGSGFIYSQSAFNKGFTNHLNDYITQSEMYPSDKTIPLANLGSYLSSKDYKMLFVYNFNPVSSLPNQNIVKKSFSREDLFIVVLDMFLNETTKFADIVIPAKFDLECDDILTSYFMPGISINQGGPCPYSDCLSNHEFFQILAKKMGWKDVILLKETQHDIVENCIELLPEKIQKNLRANGYHVPFNTNDIPFDDFKFPTSNGRIQMPSDYTKIFDPQLDILLPRSENEFYLLSPSHKYFIHSQFGEIHEDFKKIFGTVFLNSLDIEYHELDLHQEVIVSNNFGEAKYLLEQNNTLKRGIALIYSGLPYANSECKNVNIFTPENPEESGLSGAYFSVIVKIYHIDKK